MRLEARELPKATVPSVLKAARLLDELAVSREPLSLGELASRLKLPKSTTLGLCTSLTLSGLLKRYDDGTYHLGTHLVDLAHAYLSRTDLPREFAQALTAFPELEDDGAVLAVRENSDVVYVACRNGSQPIGITYRIGMRLPAHCTATGKALLSSLDDAEIRKIYRGTSLQRLTPHSITTLKGLLSNLAQARQQGYALDDEETRPGMICIGVPVADPAGGPAVAAVAVSMLKGTETPERRARLIRALQALAGLLFHRIKLLRW